MVGTRAVVLSPAPLDLRRPGTSQYREAPPGTPELLLVDVAEQVETAARMAPRLLDARECTRAAAFRNAEDRASYLVAHVGLRLLLGHITGGDPAQLRMGRAACPGCGGPNGRPVLVGGDLSFSLSHTRALVLLAVADVPVGVDVEAVPSAAVVADTASVLPTPEQLELAQLPLAARPDAFVRAWARREACGKAAGTGLAHDGMERFVGTGPCPAPAGPDLELYDVAAPDGYAAAAALALSEGDGRGGASSLASEPGGNPTVSCASRSAARVLGVMSAMRRRSLSCSAPSSALVHTAILEERNEDLERIPGWLEHELADKPAAHANLARPFLHWILLRRARQRAAFRRHPASADRDLRRRVSVALDFLAWMDQRGLALADLAQEHIDDWIAGATSQRRYLIRYFLKWTTSRRLTRELTVPSIPRQEPQSFLDEDDRWPLLQRCLTDDALPADVRAAGAITLLFGPSTERLCHLTPEHLKFDDKHAHLILGRHPVLLPPQLAELLRRLAEQPQLRPQLSRVHPGPRWLFPGMVPGKPIPTHGMTQKLNRHGILVRTARNAALAALAADLPSPILADVTGIHRNTALRWVAYARRDWAEYLAARAEDEAVRKRGGRKSGD